MGWSLAYSDEFFKQAASFETFQTASGPIKVPTLYDDVIAMAALFSVSMKKTRKLLPTEKLKPISLGRGKAIYGLTCFEYRDSTIGKYNEVGFGIPCLYDPVINIPVLPALLDMHFPVVFYISHLPVTTKFAFDFETEVWGYPKFLAEIRFEESEDTRRCILHADNRNILTLEVHKGKKLKPDRWDLNTITVKDNTPLRTTMNTRGELWASRSANSASLSLGDHPLSDELRSLELDTSPLKTMYYPKMQAILNAPKALH